MSAPSNTCCTSPKDRLELIVPVKELELRFISRIGYEYEQGHISLHVATLHIKQVIEACEELSKLGGYNATSK